MDSTLRRSGPESKLGLTFSRACLVLEGVVLDLLGGDWEEVPRGLSLQMSVALRQAARDAGWWDRESALRALESLLSLPPREVLPVRWDVGMKLLELLTVLKEGPATRSA